MLVKEILALLIGYLLGSIPTAYIITRRVRGADIRRLGGGNIGTLNTMKEVGKLPALIVLIVDVGKGVAAVAIAYWAFKLPPLYVMLAGLAAVIGHMWMVFLKFSGGRGMGAAIGAILTIFIIYGEWLALGIFAIIIVIPLLITRNVALSMSVGFLGLIFITWLVIHSTSATILAIVLGLLVGGKFLPTAIASWRSSKTKKDFVFSEKATKKQ